MSRTQEQWIDEYKRRGTFWIHDGNPKRPHALLTSGLHSNGFFNSKPLTEDSVLLAEIASDMVMKIATHLNIGIIQRVVGPQTGATKLAFALADALNRNGASRVTALSPKKRDEHASRWMEFSDKEKMLLPDKTVLLCEDVITTGGSVGRTEMAVVAARGEILPYVITIVNRSGQAEVDGKKIIALINQPMPTWNPEKEQCPLCAVRSLPLRPRDPADNWQLLTQDYPVTH